MTKALLIIDMQNDFMDNGAFPVRGALSLVPLIRNLMQYFPIIIASKDCHPPEHKSFAANHSHKKVGDTIMLDGILHTLWPVHCVEGTYGQENVEGIDETKFDHIVLKGSNPAIDSYSAFFDNARQRSTDLDKELKRRGVDELYLSGVATDYCVKFTALDACSLGYKVYVITDACKGIELKEDDTKLALSQMKEAGAHIISSQEIKPA